MITTVVLDSEKPELVNVTVDDGLKKTKKTVYAKDFITALGQNLGEKNEGLNLSLLPKNVIASAQNGDKKAYIFLLERRQNLHPYNGKDYFIPYPRMLFVAVESEGRLNVSYVVAIKGNGPVTGDQEVFRYPFSHIYEDTHICFGSAPPMTSKGEIERVVEIFYNSPNAGHMWNPDHLGGQLKGYKYSEMLEFIEKLDEYPEDTLLPYGTVDSWLSKIK